MTLLLLLACTETPSGPDETTDTGEDLRARPFDEQVLLVSHNGFNSTSMGFPVANQHLTYEEQLDLGVRGFMLDVYDEGDGPVLCHGDCVWGSQPFAEALERIDAWLLDHPDELVVFIIQEESPVGPMVDAIVAQGLDQRAIVPPTDGVWPSWRELVDGGEQLLVTTQQDHPDVPDWFAWTYGMAWDNPYSAETVDDFSCEPLRGNPANPLFLLNHFLTAPIASEALAEQANTEEALLDHVDRCEDEAGQKVNWLAIDFVGVGDAPEVLVELQTR